MELVCEAARVLRAAGWQWPRIRQWLADNQTLSVKVSLRLLEQVSSQPESAAERQRSKLNGLIIGAARRLEEAASRAAQNQRSRPSNLDGHWSWVAGLLSSGVSVAEIRRRLQEKLAGCGAVPSYWQVLRWVKRRSVEADEAVPRSVEGSAHTFQEPREQRKKLWDLGRGLKADYLLEVDEDRRNH